MVLLLGPLGVCAALIGAPSARAQDGTVAGTDLVGGGAGTPLSVTVNTAAKFQTIEGFGGAIAFYNGWVTAHPYKEEIYEHAFAGLNLSMLRLANWFRYQGTTNFDTEAAEFVAAANRSLGRPVPILMSSWSPPAFLKSNGEVGNGGTLASIDGNFAYDEFADYWYDSLLAYQAIGVSPTWISIQNEPDWEADYDSCIFRPSEGWYNGANWAGYPNALSATFQRLAGLPSPPKLLGPETVGIGYNVTQNYAATMNPDHFYGLAYHLYHGSSDGTPDGYNAAFRDTAGLFRGKPKFMTEFGLEDRIESAVLIHNALTEGQVSGYNHWSLVWPGTSGGLIQIEFPWNPSEWTNAPPGTATQSQGWWLSPSYWSMKHFSYYITPGSRRVAAACNDPDVRVSAYMTADDLRLVTVLINESTSRTATLAMNPGSFAYFQSGVYQTAGEDTFALLGPVGGELLLPPASLTTVVMDRLVAVGPATNPSPAPDESGVAYNRALTWTPGSNALAHALYLGTDSNAVAQATPASPEFRELRTATTASPALAGNTTHFWRVDAIAGANTNVGPVWAFSTAPLPALVHRYSFNEAAGTTISDSEGGPAWNGTLPNGGTPGGGVLTLDPGAQQYVQLPAGIVAALGDMTIEAWVRLQSTANWTRIFDFGNNTAANLFLTPRNGNDGRLRFAITTGGPGAEQQINTAATLAAGRWYHLVVTLRGNIGTLYLDGAPAGTGTITLNPSSLGSTQNNFLGRSQYNDPYLDASFDEFRIYSVALSAAEIAATHALGPDAVLDPGSPDIRLLTVTPTSLTLAWPHAAAGFKLQSRPSLSAGAWNYDPSPAPQVIDGQWRVTLPVRPGIGSTYYRLIK